MSMQKLLLAVLATTSLLFTACTKKETSNEKVLKIGVPQKVKGMDPIFANDRYSGNEVARVYEGLLEYHYLKRPYTLKPNLAEALPTVSKDGFTYTFKIKPGVLFQDDKAFKDGKGRELEAKDFVYSIKRLADPKLQSTGWWVLKGKLVGLDDWRKRNGSAAKVNYDEEVEGIKAIDKYTLQFKLAKPFPQFLYALAMPFTFVVSREVVEYYGPQFLNHPVGTGAFMLPEFRQTLKMTYKKNPTFRKKLFPSEASEEFKHMLANAGKQLPLVDKLVVSIIEETQPRWLNFQKGKIDFLEIPKDNFDSAVTPDRGLTDSLGKKGIELKITPSLDVTYIGFNHDNKTFQNVKLRRAMMLAYDVNEANRLFYNKTALPAQSVIPPGITGYIKNFKSPYRLENREKAVAMAKQLMVEAGHANGEGLPVITYDCAAGTDSRQQGDYFAKQMAQIGIKVKVVSNPWPQLQSKITKRTIELYGIAWGADYPDAENFLQLLYGPNRAPGANGSGYDNPEFNRLFKVSSVMQDSPERTALYEKMYRMAAEEVPWIYGVHRQTFMLQQGWLKNYISTDFEAGRAKYLDLNLNKKTELLKKF
jgi:oligopeptide transport system substrate-binding protein